MQKLVCGYQELDNLAKEIYGHTLSDLEGKKTPAQRHEEKFMQGFIEAYKKDLLEKNACLSFTLQILNAEELDKTKCVPHPHYPFIHSTLSSPAKKVSDDVQDIFEIRFEDLEPFVNQYILSDMHNAYCSLMGYDELTKRALDREDSWVLFYEPDELKFMKERGLTEQSLDGYVTFKNVGQLMTKEGDKFVPVKFQEIPAFAFSDWVDKQDDIEIIDDDAGDFWYYQKQVKETLEAFKENPLLWHSMPVSALLEQGFNNNQKTL